MNSPPILLDQVSASDAKLAWLQWLSKEQPRKSTLRVLVGLTGKAWRDSDGCGALVWAMRQQRKKAPKFVQLLVDEGFDPSEPHGAVSPLFEACYQRDLKSLKLLLDAGADPNPANQASPIAQACIGEGRLPFIEALVRAGASVAPSSHFVGIVPEFAKMIERFDRFHAGSLWNGLADTLALYPAQWQDFSTQFKDWATENGGPAFVSQAHAWLSKREALMISTVTPFVKHSISRRI